MGRSYPTKVRIAGTLSSTEAVYQLVKSLARERLTFRGQRISTPKEAAKAVYAAVVNGGYLELACEAAKAAWHEHLENACRSYDLSYEVIGHDDEGKVVRHVAYVGHIGYLPVKTDWKDKNQGISILSFPKTSLKEFADNDAAFE